MDYILTDKGLQVLDEMNLRSSIDEKLKDEDPLSRSIMYSGEITDYVNSHRIHPVYRERFSDEDFLPWYDEEFKIFSFMIPNFLSQRGVIPENLPDDLMTAIGVYVSTEWYTRLIHFSKSYAWRNDKFQTCMYSDTHGDFYLQQYDHTLKDGQMFLFPEAEALIKKFGDGDVGKMYGHYDYWIPFLTQLIYFCCQTGMEVPFRNDFEHVFYGGRLPSDRPGMVTQHEIDLYIKAKEDPKYKKFLRKCLPKYPNFMEQKDNDWNFDGFIENYNGFIIDGNLVYCEKQKNGPIDFLGYGKLSPIITFTSDMIKEAMYGTIRCIVNGGSRNPKHDPGLVLRYFPYELYE